MQIIWSSLSKSSPACLYLPSTSVCVCAHVLCIFHFIVSNFLAVSLWSVFMLCLTIDTDCVIFCGCIVILWPPVNWSFWRVRLCVSLAIYILFLKLVFATVHVFSIWGDYSVGNVDIIVSFFASRRNFYSAFFCVSLAKSIFFFFRFFVLCDVMCSVCLSHCSCVSVFAFMLVVHLFCVYLFLLSCLSFTVFLRYF